MGSVPDELPPGAVPDMPPEVPDASPEDYPRRWYLYRREDVSGMSGNGVVAYGIQYPDGVVAYRWTTSPRTTQFAESVHDVQHIHGHEGRTLVKWIDPAEPTEDAESGQEKTIAEVYEDRNALAIGLAKLANCVKAHNPGSEIRSCWKPDEGDDADASEWAIIYVWLPTGQVSWHVPRDLAEQSGLPKKNAEWDGHSREEKNSRIMSLGNGGDLT